MTETLPATPPTWRLRLWTAVAWLPQWAIVLLAIILLLAATAWGLLSPIIRERQAIRRLEEYSDTVVYGGEFFDDTGVRGGGTTQFWDRFIAYSTNNGTWRPEEISVQLGQDTPVTSIHDLYGLRGLQNLGIEGKQWSNIELTHLTAFRNCRLLSISQANVTSDGWTCLARLPLVCLDITDCELGVTFFSTARTMPKLVDLRISACRFTDDELQPLAGHLSLSHLGLDNTHYQEEKAQVTSDCIEVLELLPRLVSLDISSPAVDDAFLRQLGRLKNLRRLQLVGTKITDAGLAAIPATVHLDLLTLSRTGITDAGLMSLKHVPPRLSFPNTRVRWTEPLRRWILAHKFESLWLDDSMLDPKSAAAAELRKHIPHLTITAARTLTDE
jgi:hypothetical protein